MLKAGESSQDLCWPMPLDEDYAEGLKTNFADVANVAGRAGGAITAAKFLQRFTAGTLGHTSILPVLPGKVVQPKALLVAPLDCWLII